MEATRQRAAHVGVEMTRDEYLARAREFAARGMDLPQSKLTPLDVDAIRSAARQRDSLRRHIRDELSNAALARKMGVHVRTIEKALSGGSWGHV